MVWGSRTHILTTKGMLSELMEFLDAHDLVKEGLLGHLRFQPECGSLRQSVGLVGNGKEFYVASWMHLT